MLYIRIAYKTMVLFMGCLKTTIEGWPGCGRCQAFSASGIPDSARHNTVGKRFDARVKDADAQTMWSVTGDQAQDEDP